MPMRGISRFAWLLLLLPLIAVNGDSLWIDEGNSAWKAIQPGFNAWWATLLREGGTDVQMPLYMLWLWVWEKVAGSSEFALRCANLPWVLLGQFALFDPLRKRGYAVAAVALGLYPFLWTYTNEVRPYAMQYAGAALVLAELCALSDTRRVTWRGGFGLVLLAGSSLLGVPWVGAAVVAGTILLWGKTELELRRFRPLILAGAVLCGIVLYYVWTLQMAGRPSDAGKTTVQSLGFTAYELLGFAVPGAGRLELRANGVAALIPSLPWLIQGALAICIVLVAGANELRAVWSRRATWAAVMGIGIPVLFLLTLAFVRDFRLLGRHLTPVAPVITVLAGIGVAALLRGNSLGRIAAVVFIGFWMIAAGSVRFSPRHAKEDYRAVTAVARDEVAAGRRVWWAADVPTGKYYGLSFESGLVNALQGPSKAHLVDTPELIVLSEREDTYDRNGAVRQWIETHEASKVGTVRGFELWRVGDPAGP
jgi:hypothetical protein